LDIVLYQSIPFNGNLIILAWSIVGKCVTGIPLHSPVTREDLLSQQTLADELKMLD